MSTKRRYAVIEDPKTHILTVRKLLPTNYLASYGVHVIFIEGCDFADLTLDGYVIPRLASGGITAREI